VKNYVSRAFHPLSATPYLMLSYPGCRDVENNSGGKQVYPGGYSTQMQTRKWTTLYYLCTISKH